MPLTSPNEISDRAEQCGATIDVQIMGASKRSDNRWAYVARQVVPEKQGRYKELPSSLGWSGTAYNTIEANNDGSDEEGSGDVVSELPAGVDLQPIGSGAVIQNAVRRNNHEGDVEMHFAVPNNVGGVCAS